jgi:hypothetical protein
LTALGKINFIAKLRNITNDPQNIPAKNKETGERSEATLPNMPTIMPSPVGIASKERAVKSIIPNETAKKIPIVKMNNIAKGKNKRYFLIFLLDFIFHIIQ